MSENEAGLIECCLIFDGIEFFNSLGYKRTSGALVKTNPAGFYEYTP